MVDKTSVELNNVKNKKIKFEVFRRMEFNSDRKRMSILVKDPTDGLIKLYIKGADMMIMSRLDTNQTS